MGDESKNTVVISEPCPLCNLNKSCDKPCDRFEKWFKNKWKELRKSLIKTKSEK